MVAYMSAVFQAVAQLVFCPFTVRAVWHNRAATRCSVACFTKSRVRSGVEYSDRHGDQQSAVKELRVGCWGYAYAR